MLLTKILNFVRPKSVYKTHDSTMADPGWGIWGKCPPPQGRWRRSLSKIATKLCQAKIGLSTRESMHILLAFITNSPETKANQTENQTNYKLSPSTFVRT